MSNSGAKPETLSVAAAIERMGVTPTCVSVVVWLAAQIGEDGKLLLNEKAADEISLLAFAIEDMMGGNP